MFEEEAVKHYENLTKSALRLNEIVKEQQERINKAIEYLEDTPRVVKSIHYRDKESNYVFIEKTIKNELLEILKGVQDERITNI